MKKRIYNRYAFSCDEREKAKINHKIYKELETKYKILQTYNSEPTERELQENDIVYSRKACYHHGEYKIYKRPKELNDLEIALICDKGNLFFGHMWTSNDSLEVFED